MKYEPDDAGNIVTHALRQIAENSEIVLSVKAVSNWITGFTCYLSNEAKMYRSKHISIRQTCTDFNEIMSCLRKGYDFRSRATYNFCQRVHFLKESEAKYKFMYQVVSAFQYDMKESLERFSEVEGQLVQGFFDNPFGQ